MKTRLLFITSLLSFYAFGQFTICNTPTSANLKDVYFLNASNGIAVGDSGTIIRSADGGLSWTKVLENDTVYFNKVRFFNSTTGLAIGSHIFKTTDGGVNWTFIPSVNIQHFDIEILNDSTCLVTGSPIQLIKTTDVGNNFIPLTNNQSLDLGLISFINEQIGYGCGYSGGISTTTYKTIDGGSTWMTLKDTTQPANPTVMEALEFTSEHTGFKAGWYNPHLQKTSNQSQTWQTVSNWDSVSNYQLNDLHISINNPNTYYACGWYGEIYKSIDQGDSWFLLNSGVTNLQNLYGIYFIDDHQGWVCGSNGLILKTTSGGIGITEIEQAEVKVYPSPTSQFLNVKMNTQIHIINSHIIHINGELTECEWVNESKVNVQQLKSGVYYLWLNTTQGTAVKPFIKL